VSSSAQAHASATPRAFGLAGRWKAPEPSAYFDTRLQARLREEAAQPVGLRAKWLRMWRIPALAGALGAMAIGSLSVYKGYYAIPAQNHECAVQDVQALDRNYDLLKDLDSLDGDTSTDQPTDAEL